METQTIPLPGKRRPASWQIALLPGFREHDAMQDFDAFEQALLAHGFIRVCGTQSVSHSSFSYQRGALPIEEHVLWHHPAGLVAQGHSSTSGGYTDFQGQRVPVSKRLGSMRVEARLDCGTGGELQHRAAVHAGRNASGGTDPQLDGRDVRTLSRSFHSNALGFHDFLSRAQSYGRFLPVSQWPREDSQRSLTLADELILPLTEAPADTAEGCKAFLLEQNLEGRRTQFAARLPAELRSLFLPREPRDETEKRKGLRWDPVELSLKHFSEALFFAKKRWAGSFDSELLTHWSRAALGEIGNDSSEWRSYEKGPAGLSLPMALLYAKPTNGQSEALLDVLRRAPEDVLRRWATQPDAAGYTLGLHALNRIFVERDLSHAVSLEMVVGVLGVLLDRLGPEGLVLATDRRSVLGLPLQFQPHGLNEARTLTETQRDFLHVLQWLDGEGLDWHTHLRWRTYPNTMKKEEGRPAFFQEDGPVLAERWLGEMGERATAQAHGIAALLEAKRLTRDMPAAPTPAARRARM